LTAAVRCDAAATTGRRADALASAAFDATGLVLTDCELADFEVFAFEAEGLLGMSRCFAC